MRLSRSKYIVPLDQLDNCISFPLNVTEKLTTQSEDFSRKLYIFAEKSQRYICFNKRWKLVGLVITCLPISRHISSSRVSE